MKGEDVVAAPAFWIKLSAFDSPRSEKIPGYIHSLGWSIVFHSDCKLKTEMGQNQTDWNT